MAAMTMTCELRTGGLQAWLAAAYEIGRLAGDLPKGTGGARSCFRGEVVIGMGGGATKVGAVSGMGVRAAALWGVGLKDIAKQIELMVNATKQVYRRYWDLEEESEVASAPC